MKKAKQRRFASIYNIRSCKTPLFRFFQALPYHSKTECAIFFDTTKGTTDVFP
jgi:hypothetical protein